MIADSITALPGWLLAGVALGVGFALLVGVIFAVVPRWIPDRAEPRTRNATEERRHVEIREYLDAIDEPFREFHEVAGRRVAFYLPEREVAITFDAQDYFVLDREGIEAVLVEYELPGEHIGYRLPFDPPEIESGEPLTNESAFDVLGVDPSASTEEVRAAYRERVKDAHPDHGGDAETFERVREAYTVAREWAD